MDAREISSGKEKETEIDTMAETATVEGTTKEKEIEIGTDTAETNEGGQEAEKRTNNRTETERKRHTSQRIIGRNPSLCFRKRKSKSSKAVTWASTSQRNWCTDQATNSDKYSRRTGMQLKIRPSISIRYTYTGKILNYSLG